MGKPSLNQKSNVGESEWHHLDFCKIVARNMWCMRLFWRNKSWTVLSEGFQLQVKTPCLTRIWGSHSSHVSSSQDKTRERREHLGEIFFVMERDFLKEGFKILLYIINYSDHSLGSIDSLKEGFKILLFIINYRDHNLGSIPLHLLVVSRRRMG